MARISLSQDNTNNIKKILLRPDANGHLIQHSRYPNTGESNYENIDEVIFNGNDYNYTDPSGVPLIDYYRDYFTIDEGDVEIDNINYIKIFAVARFSGPTAPDFSDDNFNIAFYNLDTATEQTQRMSIGLSWQTMSFVFSTGLPALVEDIEIGYATTNSLNPGSVYIPVQIAQLWCEIYYHDDPLICSLNTPEEVSMEHSRNINVLNFWDGEREVYDISRNSKTIILTGSEYDNGTTCTDPGAIIDCIRNMGKNKQPIVFSGFSFKLFNGTFLIKSFGWKCTSQKPEHYEYIIELEDTEKTICEDGYLE